MRKSTGLRGDITVPGDKSITHRAILLASIAQGATEIRNYLAAEDCLATLTAVQSLGIEASVEAGGSGSRLEIGGRGLDGLREPEDVLDLRNSGTGMRLLTGLLAAQPFFSVVTGDASLRSRPMLRVVDPLRAMGAEISGREKGDRAPLVIQGRRLKAQHHVLPVASSQVKSALLLAGLCAEGRTSVTEPAQSRDHTERMLKAFGADVAVKGLTVSVEGRRELRGRPLRIPGDLSSAAFFLVAGSIVPGSEITIRDVGVNPTRSGVVDVLRMMGADIRMDNMREQDGEPVADLIVRSAPLTGVAIRGDLVPRTIDEFPVLSVAAALAEGETRIEGAEELRLKETDRIAAMTKCLSMMGARITERPDGWRILGTRRLHGAVCSSSGDHRVAMAAAIAGLAADGETVVEETDCIATSFPGFEKTVRVLS